MTPLAWLLLALSAVGLFASTKWIGEAIGTALWNVNEWSKHRAYMLCAHAIVAYEFQRGRHIGPSIKYALKIMREDA